MKFEWDENKNKLNIKKHGISFEEASTVFYDDEALIISDEAHSDNEERFIMIGFSYKYNLLVVCHCYRQNESVIRIVSARKATKNERKEYLKKMKSEYDFSKGKKNPYAKMLKRQITINISEEVLEYFKEMSEKTSIPYQSLINFYLLDCVKNKKKIDIL